ncbi:MAG TPA: hypothetical protein VEK39_14240 [Solirubrobacterales bacterium]|nr:hypothetical protein [Solirubrobacterales bacterium]
MPLPAEYRGVFVEDPMAAIRFTIEQIPGQGRVVTFYAENVLRHCDNGTDERLTFNPVTFRLRRDQSFAGVRYASTDEYQVFYEVNGRLLSDGHAKGHIIEYEDAIANPSLPTQPDCSTFGKRNWTAERVY